MRNLLIFLLKNHFILLFAILEVLCFSLIVNSNSFQKASFLNSSNSLSGSIFGYYSNISDYFNLKDENKRLAEENARLRAQIVDSVKINDTVKVKVTDTLYNQQYEYTSARIINNTVNKAKNFLTLNKGYKDGIKPDMAVLCSNGVVGIVKDVSEHYSTVISFLHANFELSARIRKNGYTGTLFWNGKDRHIGTLKDISTYVKIQKGDSIVTSGYSSIFPQGIYVGKVVDFRVPEGENFYNIDVQLSVEFSKLSYVYVVKNFMKQEQESLESKTSVENEK